MEKPTSLLSGVDACGGQVKSEFMVAITQLSAERNMPKELILSTVEAALVSAYRKEFFDPNQKISVKINPTSGEVHVIVEKKVVEKVSDPRSEISLADARNINPVLNIGDTVTLETIPPNAGRIAAQTAKQVILQRIHEAEHSAIYSEYTNKVGEIVSGTVRRIEPKQIFLELGKAEAVLPQAEQIPREKYHVGQRLRAYLLKTESGSRGPQLILSRSHPNFLRRLLELEVPEILNGTVEIKAIAREPGSRSKVAVSSSQKGVDPLGCCVGLRGVRIQNIVSELNGEKIDIVLWNPTPAIFIASALSPAQVMAVTTDDTRKATAVVPDKQLSLAIGRDGQNVRLAVNLTGWDIDVKGSTEAEALKIIPTAPVAEKQQPLEIKAEPLPTTEEAVKEAALVSLAPEQPKIRFAEEILKPAPKQDKSRKKKGSGKDYAEDGIKVKKQRKEIEDYEEEEYL